VVTEQAEEIAVAGQAVFSMFTVRQAVAGYCAGCPVLVASSEDRS